MMLKSALFAAVLAAAAATGAATTASAAPAAAPAVLAGIQSTSDAVEQVRWRRHTRTVTRCIGGRRVLMRINWRGRVVSRHVVGRCWNHHRRDHRRSHHRRWH